MNPLDTQSTAPGQQAAAAWPWDMPRLKRRLLLTALAWITLAGLMAGLQQFTGGGWPALPTLLRRMFELAQAWFYVLLAPVVLLPLLYGWRGGWRQALVWGLEFGVVLFGLATVLVAGMAAVAALDGGDPWEAQQDLTPPYLEPFIARHPQLQVVRYGGRKVLLRDGKGHSAQVDGNDIAPADVTLAACSATPAPQVLGGLPPYPASRCDAVLTVRRQGTERVSYLFQLEQEDAVAAVRKHFEAWAREQGVQAQFSTDRRRTTLQASRGEQRWDLQLRALHSGSVTIVLPGGGRTLDWPSPSPAPTPAPTGPT